MAYRVKLSPPIQKRISQYLDNVDGSDDTRIALGVEDGLKEIAKDPSIGVMLSKVYNRLIYRHFFEIDGTNYNFQVAYLVDEEEETITIGSFGALPF